MQDDEDLDTPGNYLALAGLVILFAVPFLAAALFNAAMMPFRRRGRQPAPMTEATPIPE